MRIKSWTSPLALRALFGRIAMSDRCQEIISGNSSKLLFADIIYLQPTNPHSFLISG